MLIVLLVFIMLIVLDRQENYFDSSGWVPDKDYVPAERIWYKEGLKRGYFGFGEPYVDVMTGEVCVSAGAAFVPEKVVVEELYRQTDAALYEAKRKGKDCFLFADRV